MNTYIEKIVVTNFKSYGREKLEIPIGPGFVAIVGPNGAGKSNIGDAISFGLGLFSSKNMRVRNLTHLIYSSNGKREDFAKVDIYFANPEVFGYDEFVVSRTVDKTGKSVYRLNNNIIRERDLQMVLTKGGIYKEGYNIVFQGDVIKFVKMTPIERRKIIEDVVGISEYEQKKAIALEELGEAELKIRELKPLIEELEHNLEKLKQEKHRLEEYKTLTDKKYILECLLLLRERESILKSYKDVEIKKIELEKKSLELSDIIEQKKKELESIEQNIVELNNLLLPYKESSGNLSAKIQYISEQIEHKEEELKKEYAHKEDVEKKLDFLKKDLLNLERESVELERLSIDKDQEIKDVEKEIKILEEKLISIEETLSLSQDEVSKIETKEKELKTAIDQYKKELQIHIEAIQDINQKENKYKEDIERLNNELNDLATEDMFVQKLKNHEETIKKEHALKEELIKKLDKYRNQLKDLRSDIEKLLIEKANIESQLKFGEDDTIVFENIKGVYGKVEELITLKDEQYKEAIEAAASSRLSYVIVENEEVAKMCIEFLKKHSKQRMSFIPLNRIKTQNLPPYPRQKGYIDFAINLIDYDKAIGPAIRFVFGDTIVVENFDVAKSLQNYRCVSLEGEVFEKSGIITGGKSKQKSHIGRKILLEKLQSINEHYQKLKGKEQIIENDISSINSAILEKDGIIAITTKYIKDLEKSVQEVKSKRENILERIKSGKEYIELLQVKKQEHVDALEPIKEQLQYLEQKFQNLEIRKKDILDYYTNPEIQKLRVGLEKYKRIYIEKTKELGNIELSLNSNKKNIEHISSFMMEKEKELENSMITIQTIKENIEDFLRKKIQLEEELKEANAMFYQLYEQRESLEREQKHLQSSLGAFKIEHEKLLENIGNYTNELTKLQTKLDMIDESLKEKKYQEGSITKPFSSYSMQKIRDELEKTKKNLEQFTDINFKAEEDYIETKDKLEDYKEKLEQLTKDKHAIKSMIEELDTKKYNAFMDAFVQINKNFKDIYAKVSYKGKAYLSLDNEQDPFEGGVSIFVKPRGKDAQYIEAISGGEQTLAAMALIFAIQEYKPSIFYYFDEIDAHLDEDNAYLLGQMIKEKSQNIQFIVVTLRENLASFADKLIGVTSKDNISKVLTFKSLKEVS